MQSQEVSGIEIQEIVTTTATATATEMSENETVVTTATMIASRPIETPANETPANETLETHAILAIATIVVGIEISATHETET